MEEKKSKWPYFLGSLGSTFLGAVLVFALWGKVIDLEAFSEVISSKGLDFLFTSTQVAWIAIIIESVLGFALLFNLRSKKILLPTAALVAFFLFLTGQAYYASLQGKEFDPCGCFGNLFERTPAEAFWQDLGLMVPALGLAFWGRRKAKDKYFLFFRSTLAIGLTVIVVGLTIRSPDLAKLDDYATILKPGINLNETCVGIEPDKECLGERLPEWFDGNGEEKILVVADIGTEGSTQRTKFMRESFEALNAAAEKIDVWVLTMQPRETCEAFDSEHRPTFFTFNQGIRKELIRRLYRKLPRSFLLRNREVTKTYPGLPPLSEWGTQGTPEEGEL